MFLATTLRTTRGTDIISALGNGATAKVYSGSPPATGGAPTGGNTLLATLTFPNPAGTCTSGLTTFGTITGANAVAAGRPAFVDCATSGGTLVARFTAGSTGGGTSGEVQFPADFTVGLPISATSWTITEGNAA